MSVLTPSFNQGRFLGDCIGSVVNQTYSSVEHVIYDGASTDETLDILRNAPDSVRWRSEPDRGQAHAVNKAFDLSRGDIIGWLNSDDAYFDRRTVERAVAVFMREPDVAVVYGHAVLVGADNELLHFMWAPRFSRRLFRYSNFIVQPTAFLRRSALQSTLLDEEFDFTMDRELWLRLVGQGHRFVRLDALHAIDRHHETRKVYTMQTVWERESERLRATYDLPTGFRRAAAVKAERIATRLLGVALLRHARTQAAFPVRVAANRTLLRRQILTPRRFMPLLSGRPEQDHR